MNKYTQRQFAPLVGVSRYWLQIQAKKGTLVPTTDETGENFYTDDHIAIVEKLRAESPRMKKNETAETEITSETPSLPAGETIDPSDVHTPAVSENDDTDSDSDISDNAPVEEISADDDAAQAKARQAEYYGNQYESGLPDICPEVQKEENPLPSVVSKDDSKEIAPAAIEEISATRNENGTITIEVPFKLVTLDERAARIRKLSDIVAVGVIAIGFELICAKAEIGHGKFSEWAKSEFGWTRQTTNNYMRIAQRFGDGKCKNVFTFKPSTLHAMLALPEGAEQEFIDEQAEKGKNVSEMSARQVQSAVKEFNRQREEELNTLANGGDSVAQYDTPRITHGTLSTPVTTDKSAPAESPTSDEQSETKAPPPPVIYNHDGSVEYYTPQIYIDAARRVMGSIDLDPASCEKANETVKATKIYTKENSGFNEYWEGNVWMNPPYSKGVIDKFVDKLTSSGGVASWIVLVPARTDRKFFEELAAFSDAIVFTNHRVKCLRNGVDDTSGPTAGSAFFYRGNDTKKFFDEFSAFGWGCEFKRSSR